MSARYSSVFNKRERRGERRILVNGRRWIHKDPEAAKVLAWLRGSEPAKVEARSA